MKCSLSHPFPNRTSSLKRYSLPEGSQRCYQYGRHSCTEGDSRAPLILYVLTNDVIYDVICDVICESSNQMPERLHHTHVTCASLLIGCAPLPLVLKIALPPSYSRTRVSPNSLHLIWKQVAKPSFCHILPHSN